MKTAELARALRDCGASDSAIVVFGSLGRGEVTHGSDVDWTLLVDGPANVSQSTSATDIRTALTNIKLESPNPAGPFGRLCSSFELVHRIGGNDDTNRIMTQRVLLLLESKPISTDPNGRDSEIYLRVVRSVLDSYLELSAGIRSRTGVPRFLLNDVVRYWRTMAVDYGAKRRERGDEGWALRLLKLRTSRKLIFAAGLVMCFEYALRREASGERPRREHLLDALVDHVGMTPLDALARAALQHEDLQGPARKLFEAYESFLALIDDRDARVELSSIGKDDAEASPVFESAEEIGSKFGQAIEAFFFDSVYKGVIREHGVF